MSFLWVKKVALIIFSIPLVSQHLSLYIFFNSSCACFWDSGQYVSDINLLMSLSGRRFSSEVSCSIFFFSSWLSKSFSDLDGTRLQPWRSDYLHFFFGLPSWDVLKAYRLKFLTQFSICVMREAKPWPTTFVPHLSKKDSGYRSTSCWATCFNLLLAGLVSHQVFHECFLSFGSDLLISFSAFINLTGNFCHGIWNWMRHTCRPHQILVKLEVSGAQDTLTILASCDYVNKIIDLWPPNSNQFILESKWTFVAVVMKFPPGNPEISRSQEWDGREVTVTLTFKLCPPKFANVF